MQPEQLAQRFVKDWARRRVGPVIERLTQGCDAKRKPIVEHLLGKLNGKLNEAEREYIEKAFQRYQNLVLHGPISALTEETHEAGRGGHTLLEALRKLFRLQD